MCYYQLEKIFSHLDQRSEHIEPDSYEEWGLIQAHKFSQQFAKKWVEIDIRTMSYDEIHLLVSTAYYGTEDNLIEYVENGTRYIYGEGDSLSNNIRDDSGEALGYIFTVISLDGETASHYC